MAWLTNLEFVTAPTGTATADLIDGGSADEQAAELNRVIARATAVCDNTVNRPLQAASRSRTTRVPINRGVLGLHPGPWPLLSIDSLFVGSDSSTLMAVAPSELARGWIESETFMMPMGVGVAINAGRLTGRTTQVLAQYTYTAGYAHGELRATAAGGATSITLSATVGFRVGDLITIVDGVNTEQVTVTAVTSTTVLAVSALAHTHTYVAGVATAIAVHNFPEEVKQAAIWVTSALIRTRGNDSMVMSNLLQAGATQVADPVAAKNLWLARDVLFTYRAVW